MAIIARKYAWERFFDTHKTNKPENLSDDHTESCGRVDPFRCCDGAVAAEIWLFIKSGCCKDAVIVRIFVAKFFLSTLEKAGH